MSTSNKPNQPSSNVLDPQDHPVSETATLYGTVPLYYWRSQFSVREAVSLKLPRNTDDVNPAIVQLLRPYL